MTRALTLGEAQVASELEKGVSVVIPVFNSDETLGELTEQVTGVLGQLGIEFEIILVNDGSEDASWSKIRELAGNNPRIRGLNLSRNFGQHNAQLCGLRRSRFELTVIMDDDLQHPPREIPRLLKKIDEGWDVVYGVPDSPEHSRIRNFFARLTKSTVGRATGLRRLSQQSPFSAIRTDLRSAFAEYSGPDLLLDVLLGWGTTQFSSVSVDHRPRQQGKSTYSARKLFELGVLTLTAYSTAPLRFASWLGFALTGFGICVLVYVLCVKLFLGSVPGFPFLASLISIFSGTQLFTLGLFGEYLTRVFNRSLGRPTYVIRDTVGDQLSEQRSSWEAR